MKKRMLIFAGMLLMSVVAVQAQEEQEQSYQKDTTVLPSRDSIRLESPQDQGEGSINLREMTIIKATDLPAALQQTLQAPEYKGWDAPTTTIYKNAGSDIYVVEIFDGTKGNTYRFDKNGKRIKDY